MEITLDLIVFTVLAVFTLASAVLAVTTKRILRAATFLLFVLFGTAGIYFQLNTVTAPSTTVPMAPAAPGLSLVPASPSTRKLNSGNTRIRMVKSIVDAF